MTGAVMPAADYTVWLMATPPSVRVYSQSDALHCAGALPLPSTARISNELRLLSLPKQGHIFACRSVGTMLPIHTLRLVAPHAGDFQRI
jgi:hypothetical protein